MKDKYNRVLHYLRISITDRCNLRCQYCMPETGIPSIPHQEILTYDEIERLVSILSSLGVDRVRLTGGEPLVRKGVESLARAISRTEGIHYLALTTNGILLEEMAQPLLSAGVKGLNISLDTTNPRRYKALTGRDHFEQVANGIRKALSLPFASVKINCVLSPFSLNDDWLGVIALARILPVDVRLIEWMPMAGESGPPALSAEKALEIIRGEWGPLQPLGRSEKAGPAQYYKLDGFAGRVGIIPAISHCFCEDCNRLRLTATGDLKLCLFYDTGISLKPLLRGGATDGEISDAVLKAVQNKPQRHQGQKLRAEDKNEINLIDRPGGMSGIGG